MKIILIKDVKNKGKKGDIIEVANGYAGFMFRNQTAIKSTKENLEKIKMENIQKEKEVAALIAQVEETKKFIEKNPLTIKVRTSENGRIFGSISTKQLVNDYQKKYNIRLDKKKIITDSIMNALGTYRLKVQLHKTTVAELVVKIEGN